MPRPDWEGAFQSYGLEPMRKLDEESSDEQPCTIVPLRGGHGDGDDHRAGHHSASGEHLSAEELLRPDDDFGEAADTSDVKPPVPLAATKRKLARTRGLRRKK